MRKRYIGDYNHAVLSTRASGTGNSARSVVYADGILLSNYLGNGAGFTPRWGMVTPEEIERVDVLYGPFSAAYAGNSVGAVVDYVTRMPTKFEAHAKIGYATQKFDLYSTSERDPANRRAPRWATAAALGLVVQRQPPRQHRPATGVRHKPLCSATAWRRRAGMTGRSPGLDRNNNKDW